MIAHVHATAFLNSNRDPKERPEPYKLPAPWPDKKPEADVTDEERAELRDRLRRYSAFAE